MANGFNQESLVIESKAKRKCWGIPNPISAPLATGKVSDSRRKLTCWTIAMVRCPTPAPAPVSPLPAELRLLREEKADTLQEMQECLENAGTRW